MPSKKYGSPFYLVNFVIVYFYYGESLIICKNAIFLNVILNIFF